MSKFDKFLGIFKQKIWQISKNSGFERTKQEIFGDFDTKNTFFFFSEALISALKYQKLTEIC